MNIKSNCFPSNIIEQMYKPRAISLFAFNQNEIFCWHENDFSILIQTRKKRKTKLSITACVN